MTPLATLLALTSLVPPAAGGAQVPSDGIEIAFAFQRPITVLHEPVVLQFSILNRRNDTIEFNLGGNYGEFFRVRLTRPDGGSSQDHAPFRRGGIAEVGRVSLAPNEQFSHQLVFDVNMGLDQLGDYLAEVWIDTVFPFRTRSGAILKPPEASIDSHTAVTIVEKRMQGRDHPVLIGVPET